MTIKITIVTDVDFDMNSLAKIVPLAREVHVETLGRQVKPTARKRKYGSLNDMVKSRAAMALMKHFGPGLEFSSERSQQWVKDEGFKPGSASTTLTHLVRAGLVERVSPGRFKFVKPLPPPKEG